MENIMQACVQMQPQALLQVRDRRGDTAEGFARFFTGRSVARVLLVGAGSSYHAMNMARPFVQWALKRPVMAATPAQLSWLDERYAQDTLVIAASQSGTSTNTLALLRTLGEMEFSTCAVTQVSDSPVARAAQWHVPLTIPEERTGPKTMGVMGTILTVQQMALTLGSFGGQVSREEAAAFDAQIERVIQAMPSNIDLSVAWCLAEAERMRESGSFFVVGQGDAASVAGEAALKMVETLRLPVAAYELEEIVHGPHLALGPGSAMLYLGTLWEEAVRPQALCDLCQAKGGTVFRVGMDTETGSIREGRLILLTADNPLLAPYELLIPAQVISAYIPPRMGIDLDDRVVSPQERILAGHLESQD